MPLNNVSLFGEEWAVRVGGVIIQRSVCTLVVFIPVHAFQLNSAGFLSPLQLTKVEAHTLLLKDLNVCLLMEAQCQARNMGSVRPDQTVLMFCGFTSRQIPPFHLFKCVKTTAWWGLVEGKGLPGGVYAYSCHLAAFSQFPTQLCSFWHCSWS